MNFFKKTEAPSFNNMGRGDFLDLMSKLGLIAFGLSAAGCMPGGYDGTQTPSGTKQEVLQTGSEISPWITTFLKLNNPQLIEQLRAIDIAFPDPLVKSRVAQVLVDNFLASQPGGKIEIAQLLRESGRVIGGTCCADSRVILDTIFYKVDEAGEVVPALAVVEQSPLGGAPRVYAKGVNVSLAVTHANSLTDLNGCGALDALKKLAGEKGFEKLVEHGVDPTTLVEIRASLLSTNPEQQAMASARLQAIMNTYMHGGEKHFVVAAVKGHADNSLRVLGVVDEKGLVSESKVPQLVREYLATQNRPTQEVIAHLAKGQIPFEAVFSASQHNIADVMGPGSEVAGNTFKVTVRPQSGNLTRAINLAEVEHGIAAINYPLAHEWGPVLWVTADTEAELALMRQELLKSNKLWEFLGRDGSMVEALIGPNGRMSGIMRVTKLSEIRQAASSVSELKAIGLSTTEIQLSARTIYEAEKILSDAKALGKSEIAAKFEPVISKLKAAGRVGLGILKFLKPLFDAGNYLLFFDEIYLRLFHYSGYIYTKSATPAEGRAAIIDRVLTTEEYNAFLAEHPNVEPYLGLKLLHTTLTQEELAYEFSGLIRSYSADIDADNLTQPGIATVQSGPVNPESQFQGIPIDKLAKALLFKIINFNDMSQEYVMGKKGPPLLFFPLPKETGFSPSHIDYRPEGLAKQPFMLMNTETGEFLTTNMPGEMIVPVYLQSPRNGVEVVYYLYMKSDGNQNISIECVSYKEP